MGAGFSRGCPEPGSEPARRRHRSRSDYEGAQMKAIRIAFLAAAAATCRLGISQAQAQQQLPAAWCVIKREFLDTQGTWIKEYAVARREDMAWMGPWDMLDCNLTFTDAFKKRDALAGTGSSGGAAPPVVAAAPPVAPLPPVAVGPTVPSTPAVQSPAHKPTREARTRRDHQQSR